MKRALVAAVLLTLAAGVRPSAAGEPPPVARDALDREYEETVKRLSERCEAIKADDNAATHYRKAFAALPKTENQALDEFLTLTPLRAAPEALGEMPGAKEEVRKYREAVADHLRRAAALEHCAFDLDWRKAAGMLMPHLAKVRNLARRAVCYGKLLEIEGRKREAARVYLDIIRMGLHLDQDPALISVLVGVACAGIARSAVEGLLARGVDAETARLLLGGLRNLPSPAFDASRAVDVERVWYGGWMRKQLLKAAESGREKLLAYLGDFPGPHKPWQAPDTAEEIRRLLTEAFEVHDAQMRQLSAAVKGPYHEGRRRVERLVKMQESYWQGETREGHFAGALVRLIAPPVRAFYTRAARAEAQLRGLSLLAAASLAKAETGEYPADLAALTKHFPKGLPADPFTGGSFSYWLAGGLPAAACKADDPEVKKEHPEFYHFGLSYRLKVEKWKLEKWRKRRKRRRDEEPVTAPEEEDADGVW